MPSGRDILVAVIGRPHGVRGLVHVTSHASSPEALARMTLHDDKGRVFRIAWRGEGLAALLDAAGQALPDRTAAERVVNLRLHVDRASLPEPEDDEFYLADLVGLDADAPDGRRLGRVRAVHDYGAGTSLEIAPEEGAGTGGATFLVPFTRQAVPDVDLDSGRVVVRRPAEVEIEVGAGDEVERGVEAGA